MSPRTEQELLDCTVDLAIHCRWSVHHDLPSRRAGARWSTLIQGHAGFPDCCLAKHGRVLFRELKGYDVRGRVGRLSCEQRDWGAQLCPGWQDVPRDDYSQRAELRFDVWVPDDFEPLIVPLLTGKVIAHAAR